MPGHVDGRAEPRVVVIEVDERRASGLVEERSGRRTSDAVELVSDRGPVQGVYTPVPRARRPLLSGHGHHRPVSRTVMLSRPGARSSQGGAVPLITFGTPW